MFSLQKMKTFPGKLLISWKIFGSRLLEHLVSPCMFSWRETQKDRLAMKNCVVSFLPTLSHERLQTVEILFGQGIKGKNWGLLQKYRDVTSLSPELRLGRELS